MKKLMNLLVVLIMLQTTACTEKRKEADKMDWWKEAKFGMFIHWGIYSVPAGMYNGNEIVGYSEWLMNNAKVPVAEYKKYAAQFNPTDFDADSWVKLAKEAGMKYIVITSKHHDGFAMFDSKVSTYDIMDASPFKRDVIKEMADACKKYNMPFGLYYSQAQDWYVPGGAAMGGQWDTAQHGNMDEYLDKIAVPQVSEILNNYGDIKILWWDTPTDMTPERAAKFFPEMKKHPNLIFNDRLGGGVEGDLNTPEQFIPATGIPGKNWESCMTMNDSWGFKTNDHNWKSSEMLLHNLIDIVSKGGNYLLNVGPTQMGIIPNESVERLQTIGNWLKTNGDAIYGTTASPFSNLSWGRATVKESGKKHLIYLHVFEIPEDNQLWVSGLASKVDKVYPLLEKKKALPFTTEGYNLKIDLSGMGKDIFATVIVLETKDDVLVYNGPEIKAEFSTFLDTIEFEIKNDIPNTVVRYTIDGTTPNRNSAIAQGKTKVTANENIMIKAMCFEGEKSVSGLVEKQFIHQTIIKSTELKNPKRGLQYKYYEGKWSVLPDFSGIEVASSGVAKSIGIEPKRRDNDYGLTFNGYLLIPQSGIYKFILTSDDGSSLRLSDQLLVNDGLHGMIDKTIELALEKGFHPIEVNFFQLGGGDGLELKWQAVNDSIELISQSHFFN